MDSSMAETVQEKQWYLAVGDRSIGPLTTELVARGIRSGKVPLSAWACQVGANQWSALSSFSEFQDIAALQVAAETPAKQQRRSRYGRSPFALGTTKSAETGSSSYPPTSEPPPASGRALPTSTVPPDSISPAPIAPDSHSPVMASSVSISRDCTPAGSVSAEPGSPGQVSLDLVSPTTGTSASVANDEDEPTGQHTLLPYERVEQEPLPSLCDDHGEPPEFATSAPLVLPTREAHAGHTAIEADARVQHDDLAIDITFDEDHESSIDWRERFQSYFLVGTEVELPDERKLLQSLHETPRDTFLHDEALWNLSLCLAFGSDEVANTSARTFFEAIGADHSDERVEWICRTLLSKGFMPSGIPRSDGKRGIDVLRQACPSELRETLEREAVD